MIVKPLLGFFFGPPGMGEMLILAAVGLLIFGKRLPEVGKSLGKGILEFKKGLSGVKDQLDVASHLPNSSSDSNDQPPTAFIDAAEEAPPTPKSQRSDSPPPPQGA